MLAFVGEQELTSAPGCQSYHWLWLHELLAGLDSSHGLYRDARTARRQGQLHVHHHACPAYAFCHACYQSTISWWSNESAPSTPRIICWSSFRFLDKNLAQLRRWQESNPDSCCHGEARPIRGVIHFSKNSWREQARWAKTRWWQHQRQRQWCKYLIRWTIARLLADKGPGTASGVRTNCRGGFENTRFVK